MGGVAARARDRLVPLLHRVPPFRRLLAEREHDIPRIPLAFAGTALPRRPLLPQPWVTTPAGTRARLDDFLGAGFALVGLGLSPRAWAQPADRPLWRTLATRAVHVVPPGAAWPATAEGEVAVRDEGILVTWLGRAGVVLVVRPDRHLFGVYAPREASRAAEALREALQLR
jgi:3-(3-hydroxy-phenyl)propionate hydroxylase